MITLLSPTRTMNMSPVSGTYPPATTPQFLSEAERIISGVKKLSAKELEGQMNLSQKIAENDFQYFKASYDAGIVANMMGAMAQGICEKYMKHLISEYYKPDDAMQQKDFENILRTHSLNRLMKFLKANMGAEFSKNTQTHMRMIDGFYFSTRYPGDDSIEIDGDDVETCNDAIELCRTEVLGLERELKKCEV